MIKGWVRCYHTVGISEVGTERVNLISVGLGAVIQIWCVMEIISRC